MFLALKRFDQAVIHLSLASVPSCTSLPCVLEDAGKINATPSQTWAGRAVSALRALLLVVCCLLSGPGALHLPGAGEQNGKVTIRIAKWKKVR